MLIIAVAFGKGESSFFLIMLTSFRLCIHVSNGKVRLVLIFVDPALCESFGPGVLFYPTKVAKYVFTTKKSSTFDPLLFFESFLCYKLKQSKK